MWYDCFIDYVVKYYINRKIWGEFVIAIMGYYVIIYFLHKYFIKHIPLMMCLIGIASLIVYVFFFPYKTETGEKGLYG